MVVPPWDSPIGSGVPGTIIPLFPSLSSCRGVSGRAATFSALFAAYLAALVPVINLFEARS